MVDINIHLNNKCNPFSHSVDNIPENGVLEYN